MGDLPQHPYECQCKGHQGSARTFMAAPPEWFASKSISTPKNCPDCRSWMKSQVDEAITCECGNKFRISAKAKISHHKKVGEFQTPKKCRACLEGKKIPRSTIDKRKPFEIDKRKQEKKPEKFSDLVFGINPSSRKIVVDANLYNSETTRSKLGDRETRLEHLEHHLPLSAKSLSGSSPTSLVPDASDGIEFLRGLESYMLNSDSNSVREYRISNDRIARITFTGDHDGLEKTILRENDDGTFTVITSHDKVTVSDVMNSSWYTGIRSV